MSPGIGFKTYTPKIIKAENFMRTSYSYKLRSHDQPHPGFVNCLFGLRNTKGIPSALSKYSKFGGKCFLHDSTLVSL